jgi:spoIIIJ-associated protein
MTDAVSDQDTPTPQDAPETDVPESTDEQSTEQAAEQTAPAVDPADRLRALEEEGDIAADYLEELLDIADLDGDIDIDVDGDRASVEIRGASRLAELNQPRGELMDALQELARLAVQARTGNRSRLMKLAEEAIAKAKQSGTEVPLSPMNPFERKIVHDVAKREGLRSESDGDGKGRHVVIYPAS